MEQGLSKKLKGSDGLPLPVSSDTSNSTARGTVLSASQILQHETSLKDGSNGNSGEENAERTDGAENKQTRDIDAEFDLSTKGIANEASTTIADNTMAHANVPGYVGVPVENAVSNTAYIVSAGILPSGISTLDERQLKRERRKQANRESARKSRLRKQAEYEELVHRWDSMKMENAALKSELERLNADSEKLRQENAALMEKLEADSTETNATEKVLDKSDRNLNPDRNTCKIPSSKQSLIHC